MGFWVVLAMLACGVGATVAALVALPFDEPEPPRPRVRRVARAAPIARAEPDPARPLTWIALGASDAAGTGTPDPARDNWVARLAADLPSRVTARNLAVPGSTLADARREQLPAALAAEPDVVSLWLVVNDVLGGVPLPDYEDGLDALLAALRGADAEAVVGNLVDLSAIPALAAAGFDPAALRALVERWNAAIARLAAAHGATLVDFDARSAELAARPDFLGPDGFHPSPAGQDVIAALFRPAVEAALERAAQRPLPVRPDAVSSSI